MSLLQHLCPLYMHYIFCLFCLLQSLEAEEKRSLKLWNEKWETQVAPYIAHCEQVITLYLAYFAFDSTRDAVVVVVVVVVVVTIAVVAICCCFLTLTHRALI